MTYLKNKNMFFTIVTVMAAFIYIYIGVFPFETNSDWVLGYALIGTVLLLNHFIILLPPEGNALSMDSAVYLGCVFVFGLETSLIVLLLASLIQYLYDHKLPWWVYLFNLSIYTLMITSAYYIFILTGGLVGNVNSLFFFSYLLSLTVYFAINVLMISIFFWIVKNESLISAMKGVIKGAIESYMSTMLLSIVLSFLLKAEPLFGLIIFSSIAMLLSFAFKQHFRLYQEVANKANIDHLTGLNNHGYFKEILDKKLFEIKNSKQSLSLAMLDIDDFKKYNDGFGHLQGDSLLKFFGERLEEECNPKGYVVARYGGEEFVILMPDTRDIEASVFIDKLRKQVNDTYFKGVELLPYGCLSFSAGIIEHSEEIISSSEFLSQADQAMYYAKAQGKNNTHVFGTEMESISIDYPVEELEQQLKLFLGKDIYTYRHSKRVFKYTVEFSKLIDLKDHERKTLMLGALIHDIGKLEVPRDVINKKGKLTDAEWEMVKMHVTWGKDIVAATKKFEDLIPCVELHHERYDGRGYPHGLKELEIPKLARILCIIDSFDAMTTERPYQKTKTFVEAIVELRACSGTQFDPFYVEGFIDYINEKYITHEETYPSPSN
ncbi:diguanylate cyclase [Radiobacillus sp. PE A8.2]|uniref:bifunctional diguanylate cyclase/phosphohydrolase n=1 Tax=Radiobacillus sp. PE A8.2 TaxID=3380349 RepID=UPI00388E86A7